MACEKVQPGQADLHTLKTTELHNAAHREECMHVVDAADVYFFFTLGSMCVYSLSTERNLKQLKWLNKTVLLNSEKLCDLMPEQKALDTHQ